MGTTLWDTEHLASAAHVERRPLRLEALSRRHRPTVATSAGLSKLRMSSWLLEQSIASLTDPSLDAVVVCELWG